MNLTPGVEEQLWARAGVSRIVDIRGFPFPSYDAFRAAVTKGDAHLGIEYAAARDLARVTKSPAAALLILGLSWVTPLLALASVILPFSTGNWWALGGAPSAFIGQVLANPYNPAKSLIGLAVAGAIRHVAFARTILQAVLARLMASPHDSTKSLIKLAVVGAILHVASARSILEGTTWISFCFAVSAIDLWVLNRLAWTWAHEAALHSEALAALLFKTGNLHIRDRQGTIHNAEPSREA
jgi:hypothetical protein